MSALQKENPRPLAKAKPKLRQNVLREKLKKQRQELANDVIALESNIVTKAARELDDQRAAASEMTQARQSAGRQSVVSQARQAAAQADVCPRTHTQRKYGAHQL